MGLSPGRMGVVPVTSDTLRRMSFVNLPCHRLEPGKPVPFNIWDGRGKLLIRKGDPVVSVDHQVFLASHNASVTQADFRAWERSYNRLIYERFRQGATMGELEKSYMPSEILEADYVTGYDIPGGWVDLYEVLMGVLYQGTASRTPLDRLEGVQQRAAELLTASADNSLFALFQLMADRSLGYCAKHALLAAVLCELTASKLGVAEPMRPVLFRAALTMNIGMARQQDVMVRQKTPLSAEQKELIKEHPQIGVEILRTMGVFEEDWLELVATHHAPHDPTGTDPKQELTRILSMADQFIAKVSARATRAALPTRSALRFMVAQPEGTSLRVGSAMTAVVGLYPPGTYVTLSNGEIAVVLRRGETPTTPVTVSFMNADGVGLGLYIARDPSDKAVTIQASLPSDRVKFVLDTEKIQRALKRAGTAAT